MAHLKTGNEKYWIVTIQDLMDAERPEFDGIDFNIENPGLRWKGNTGILCIQKGSDEWNYLYQHIAKLHSFITDTRNTSSVDVPSLFRNKSLWKF